MRNVAVLGSAFALLVGAPTYRASAQIADGSFETQAPIEIGTNNGWCYGGGQTPACTGSGTPWQTSVNAGFQLDTNTDWPGTLTPAGSYYGFIQSGGSLTQQFTADASGTFILNFLDAGRNLNGYGDQTYEVLLNGSPIFNGSTTSGQAFTDVTTSPFTLVMGNLYTLSFLGTTTADETAYIDAVGLASAVPEPSTWAMMLLGFGAMGVATRRRHGGQIRTGGA